MKAATSAMNLGRDRLALVVQGKIKSAPVVQAVISRTFEISGLDGKMKPPDWRNCSTGGHPQKKHTLHSTGSGPVRRPSGKPPSGGRRSPTRTGLQALEAPGAPAGKTGEVEYLFLGNSPIIPETAPGMRSQIWNIREAWTSPGTKKHSVNWSGHRPDYAPARTGLLSFCAEPFCPPPYSRECLPAPLLFPVWGMTAGWMPCAGPSTTPVCR